MNFHWTKPNLMKFMFYCSFIVSAYYSLYTVNWVERVENGSILIHENDTRIRPLHK